MGTCTQGNPEPSCGQWLSGERDKVDFGQAGLHHEPVGGVSQSPLLLVSPDVTVTIQDPDFLSSLPVFLLSFHLLRSAPCRLSSVPSHSVPPLCGHPSFPPESAFLQAGPQRSGERLLQGTPWGPRETLSRGCPRMRGPGLGAAAGTA